MPDLDPQAGHLDRESRRGEDAVEQVAPLEQRRVVEQHRRAHVVTLDLAASARVVRELVQALAGRVRVRLGLRDPEEDLREWILQRVREDRADLLGGRRPSGPRPRTL